MSFDIPLTPTWLFQAMLKDYLLKKERGQLKCTQAEQRFAHTLQPTELNPR